MKKMIVGALIVLAVGVAAGYYFGYDMGYEDAVLNLSEGESAY